VGLSAKRKLRHGNRLRGVTFSPTRQ